MGGYRGVQDLARIINEVRTRRADTVSALIEQEICGQYRWGVTSCCPRERTSMGKINDRLLEFFAAHFSPGVIGLVGTRDTAGLAIREAQKEITVDRSASLWSHCFICGEVRPDRRGQSTEITKSPYIFESDLVITPLMSQFFNGAQENWIGKWCGESVEHAAVIDFSLSEDEKECILATALQLVDDQVVYPVHELIGTWFAIIMHERWFPNPLDTPHALYCSAFVRHCYREAGRDFLSDGIDISNTAPDDIAQAGFRAGALSVFQS